MTRRVFTIWVSAVIIILSVIAILSWSAIISAAATAQTRVCVSHTKLAKILKERHGEIIFGTGATEAKTKPHRIEVWVNPRTNSWTLVSVDGDGLSCIFTDGRDWNWGSTLLGDPT